jgi:hypothetical protein
MSSQMELLMSQLNGAAGATAAGAPQFAFRPYSVQIDFDQLRSSDATQRALRDKVKAVPTLWSINAENRDAIEQAGVTLLHQHPCFQRLLLDMNIPADFVDPQFAKTTCRMNDD